MQPEEIRIKSISELEVVGGHNKVLGQGAYAKVRLVRLKKTGQLYALKELDLTKETSSRVTKEKRVAFCDADGDYQARNQATQEAKT